MDAHKRMVRDLLDVIYVPGFREVAERQVEALLTLAGSVSKPDGVRIKIHCWPDDVPCIILADGTEICSDSLGLFDHWPGDGTDRPALRWNMTPDEARRLIEEVGY